jgi:hypothetical protein
MVAASGIKSSKGGNVSTSNKKKSSGSGGSGGSSGGSGGSSSPAKRTAKT